MKILFISSNLIGDAILSSGILSHIIESNKKARITLITGPTSKQLFENFPNIEKIIVVKKKKFNLHWLILWIKILRYKWYQVIDLRSSFLSYFIYASKRKIFIRRDDPISQVEKLSNFMQTGKILLPKIWISDEENLMAQSIVGDRKVIAISPGGNWKPKIWPIENYNKLLIEIIKKYPNYKFSFMAVGSKLEEKIYIDSLFKNIPEELIINIMGTSLTLTYGCLSYSKMFIGNDSGLMHLAAASGIPTIGLFGPTRDDWYRPYGDSCFVIRTKENYNELRKNLKNSDKTMMESITVEEVIKYIEQKILIK